MAPRKKFDVFLSHNSKDKPWVIKLKYDLELLGVSVWLDKDEIRPGDLFAKALEQGIRESRSVAIIISPQSMKSGWVEAEYYRALNLATGQQIQLIPVLYKQSRVPGFLSDRSWVDFRDANEYENNLGRLIWGITGKKPKSLTSTSPTENRKGLRQVIDAYVEAAKQRVQDQTRILSFGLPFYDDQFRVLNNLVGELKDIAEEIKIVLPDDYDTLALSINLLKQVDTHGQILSRFRKTCPPGDEERYKDILSNLTLIDNTLSKITDASNRI